MGLFCDVDVERLMARLDRIERKLDLLMSQAGIAPLPEDDPQLDEIRALVRAGRKIEAIRRYRDATGADLGAAKQMVERMG